MVQDLVHNLCEFLVENIDGVASGTPHKAAVATPVITLTENSVTITCATTGATIYYTLDGSTPTSGSTQYSAAFTLDSSCTIKAIAIKGGKSSGIAEEEYVKPITYLTQWKMMGNSVVHTDEYLTQWKVSGNSVVDNNTILSCGDYSDVDGKYHVKISNGVSIYDIPLTEPLRKVNDVADKIEFANGVATVTRYLRNMNWQNAVIRKGTSPVIQFQVECSTLKTKSNNILSSRYPTKPYIDSASTFGGFGIAGYSNNPLFRVVDEEYNSLSADDFLNNVLSDTALIYELATPTTETIQVSPFPISPTDTYTSANDTPYSAFEYKKNVEIWSCGEYSAVDGKYHILVQPLEGSIADIALDEPLRKVNNVADSIEYADGVGTLTRKLGSKAMKDLGFVVRGNSSGTKYRYRYQSGSLIGIVKKPATDATPANISCSIYNIVTALQAYTFQKTGISLESSQGYIYVYDPDYDQEDNLTAFTQHIRDAELLYELATPTTEAIQVPQIQEADSYTCVISQGGKAVEWSSFETE